VACSTLPLAVVLHPACILDGVCSVVAAVKASLMGGFHGVVFIIIECSRLPFGVFEFALIWAVWLSRGSLTRVAHFTHFMRDSTCVTFTLLLILFVLLVRNVYFSFWFNYNLLIVKRIELGKIVI